MNDRQIILYYTFFKVIPLSSHYPFPHKQEEDYPTKTALPMTNTALPMTNTALSMTNTALSTTNLAKPSAYCSKDW